VKSGANLNFDFGSPSFDPSIYNAISGSKLFSQLELFMKGGVFGWKNRELTTTESNTLEYPIWEAYFVPKMEKFSITAGGGEMEIALDISNKLFFDSEIGMNIYEKDEKSGKFTVEVGKMELGEYSRPPADEDKYQLRMKESTSLPPGKEYEASLTVKLDAPGGPYTLETDVRTRFIPQEASMTLTTSKAVGSKIGLSMLSKYAGSTGEQRLKVWIDLNNNRKEDAGELVNSDLSYVEYTIQSQTVTIYGPVVNFSCYGNQLTSLDVTRNAVLESLYCYENLLTSLDVSNLPSLEYLGCHDNSLTTLNVSGATMLRSITCHNNQLVTVNTGNLTKLEMFRCANNRITSLDMTRNEYLTTLDCERNQLVTLDVSKNKKLMRLTCTDNQLTTLNTSNIPALTWLSCGNNRLTSLMLNNPALKELSCQNNQLGSFNIIPSTALTFLNCARNNLTTLVISHNTALTYLYCAFNQLTTLDASSNRALPALNCSFNQLVSLVVSDQGVIKSIDCESNRLRGTAITELITSLPDRTGENAGTVDFGLTFEGDVAGENNFTRTDEQNARKKNWYLY
jgi:hypothetical protein